MTSEQDMERIMEMGFTQEKAEMALNETGNNGVEAAMDWITNQQELERKQDIAGEDGSIELVTAQSLKCEDCGKLFPNADMAEFHAHKTGHVNFSESAESIQPLTPEEKKRKLEELKTKLAAKRAEREKREQEEQRLKEIQRRKEAQKSARLREDLKDLQMKKELDQRRKEKEEDLAAKAKVKAQIEADRRERAEKISGNLPSTKSVETTRHPTLQKNYDECRIQVRLSDGSTLTNSFKTEDTMKSIYDFVHAHRNDGHGPFNLMQTFPKKIFDVNDMNKTLKELNLVPSSVLILSKVV